ncbi:hypothetical protein BGX29_010402 [Mortierella sp. GBA35]|nr:hypothetical protein BGX23_005682 [Mortierella sp. AD031]KAF9092568.1 hypothetical protein BGX29_010402 [Mortierella sp. GBA35]KAG0203346.1 hypothetical protein BGX33_009164 [Mortierella sp. NVP41]
MSQPPRHHFTYGEEGDDEDWAASPTSFRSTFRGPEPGDNRIVFPVKIKNVELTALLVTGRPVTCVDTKVAEGLGLKFGHNRIARMSREASGLTGYMTDKTMQTMTSVPVKFKEMTKARFMDVDDLDYYDIHIGMDLMGDFGLKITIG